MGARSEARAVKADLREAVWSPSPFSPPAPRPLAPVALDDDPPASGARYVIASDRGYFTAAGRWASHAGVARYFHDVTVAASVARGLTRVPGTWLVPLDPGQP